MRSYLQVALSALAMFIFATTSEAQFPFDAAKAHTHIQSTTFEGTWIRRMNVEAQNASAYPLGNAVAIRNSTNELWFFYAFKPEDGPMIAMLESRVSGALVRVTFDPTCFYVLGFEDLNSGPVPTPTPLPTPTPWPTATPTPTPTPTPSPTPVTEYEIVRRAVDFDQAKTDETFRQLGEVGFGQCTFYVGGTWFYCMKPKGLIVNYDWRSWLWVDGLSQQDSLMTQVAREGYSSAIIWNGRVRASRRR